MKWRLCQSTGEQFEVASSPLTPVWQILGCGPTQVQGQKQGDKERDLHLSVLTAFVTFSNLAVLLGEGDFCDLDVVQGRH